MYQKLKKTEAAADGRSAMEAGNHFKNEANPKNMISRGNVFKMLLVIAISAMLFSCKSRDYKIDTNVDDKIDTNVDNKIDTNTDDDFEELNQALEQIPTENVDINDLKFDDGESMIKFLENYDPEFIERNGDFLKDYIGENATRSSLLKSETESSQLNADAKDLGIFYEQRRIIGALSNAALFYLKNKDGVAENSYVRETINDGEKPEQKGLYYSWGSKAWNSRQQQPQNKSCNEKYFGLDCSGFLFNVLASAGFIILPGNQATAYAYYKSLSKWNATLKNDYDKKLQFKQYKKDGLPQKEFLMGDIVFYFRNDSAKHVGIVIKKDGNLFIAQSNGSSTDCIEDNIRATLPNGNPKGNNNINRGPRIVPLNTTFGYRDIRVIRLMAEGIPISISISNITAFAALANIIINPPEISLESSENILLVGACYSESNQNPTVTSEQAVYQNYNSSSTNYIVGLPSLSPETKYFVRGFIKTSKENYIYGDAINFTTLQADTENNSLAGTKWNCYSQFPSGTAANYCYLQGASGYIFFTDNTHVEFYNRNGNGSYDLELSGTFLFDGSNLTINFGDVILIGTIVNNITMQCAGKHYVSDTEIHNFTWYGTKQTTPLNVVLNNQPMVINNRK